MRPVERYADAHAHLLDFLQNGEFLNTDGKFPGGRYGRQVETGRFVSLPYGERGRHIEALLENTDKAKVENALVCGMPFLKKWSKNEPISRNADEVKLPYDLNELVQLIEYCRAGNGDCEQSTTFIWCHSGISRRIVVDNLHLWIEEMLGNFGDQLYIDLSWVVFDDYVLPNSNPG